MNNIHASRTPHVIPYQGSKRKLASDILKQIDFEVASLYEPFAGSAAVTLAAASRFMAERYVIADKLESLTDLWKMIINEPERLIEDYTHLWESQLEDPRSYFDYIRDQFNAEPSPAALLYLIARCVKNSLRFNAEGKFNQSPDNRRLGVKPKKLASEVQATSRLLKGRTMVEAGDFQAVLEHASPDDVVYMDPPWQGTSTNRNPRYAYLLDIDKLVDELENLNQRGVPYLLSFDGTCGGKAYGKSLPSELRLKKVMLHAGRSSQATLLGRSKITMESLYISPAFTAKSSFDKGSYPQQVALFG